MNSRTPRLAAVAWVLSAGVSAQEPVAPAPPTWPAGAPREVVPSSALSEPAPPHEAFTLRFGNRPIVVLRARVLGRTPEERARARAARLNELAEKHPAGPVEWHLVGGLAMVTIAGHEAVTLLPADVDPLGGTLDAAAEEARDNLSRALAEVAEARSPGMLLRGALRALAATAAAALFGGLLFWLRERALRRFTASVEARVLRPLQRQTHGDVWKTTEASLLGLIRLIGRLLVIALVFVLAVLWLGFVLRQFPYLRPWGEAIRGFVVATLLGLLDGMLKAIPGLFTVALILLITRLAVRVVGGLFVAVEQGRLTLPGIHADIAQPTRRLVAWLLWLFAVVVAYPYLPGSGSDAFKGVSVFVGLMLSLGSSGLVNQAMSSFMITYGRLFKVGDFVRIGDVEGTVVRSGPLATKVLTRRNEEISLPNAVVTSSIITNYSARAGEGVQLRTSVTIGYAAPWRQVHAMLLEAASRTSGLRAEPPPRVLQAGLQEFYVEYALLVTPERAEDRVRVLSELHGHIQDVFNEHGVQIMSPAYEADPEAPKVVPKAAWFTPPAEPGAGD